MISETPVYDHILRDLRDSLPEKRFLHVMGVVQAGTALAQTQGVDIDKVYLAALLHDVAKGMSPEELEPRRAAGEYQLDDEDLEFPAIWHGPAGAAIARTRYGVEDEEILEAIAHHTLGKPAPCPVLRVIMAADSTEPTRVYPGVDDLRMLLRTDFQAGLVAVLRNKVADLQARGRKPHSRIFRTLQYLEQE